MRLKQVLIDTAIKATIGVALMAATVFLTGCSSTDRAAR